MTRHRWCATNQQIYSLGKQVEILQVIKDYGEVLRWNES